MTFCDLASSLQQGTPLVSSVTGKVYGLVELDEAGHPIAAADMSTEEGEGSFDTVRDILITIEDDAF